MFNHKHISAKEMNAIQLNAIAFMEAQLKHLEKSKDYVSALENGDIDLDRLTTSVTVTRNICTERSLHAIFPTVLHSNVESLFPCVWTPDGKAGLCYVGDMFALTQESSHDTEAYTSAYIRAHHPGYDADQCIFGDEELYFCHHSEDNPYNILSDTRRCLEKFGALFDLSSENTSHIYENHCLWYSEDLKDLPQDLINLLFNHVTAADGWHQYWSLSNLDGVSIGGNISMETCSALCRCILDALLRAAYETNREVYIKFIRNHSDSDRKTLLRKLPFWSAWDSDVLFINPLAVKPIGDGIKSDRTGDEWFAYYKFADLFFEYLFTALEGFVYGYKEN